MPILVGPFGASALAALLVFLVGHFAWSPTLAWRVWHGTACEPAP